MGGATMTRLPVLMLLLASITAVAPASAVPVYYAGNNHSYELIAVQTTWAGARAAAAALSYQGFPGHLATVTTAGENAFIASAFASGQAQYFAWLGGYEPNDDGVWLWGGGPEDGIQFSQVGTPTPPFNYTNWGGVEPNDFAPGEDFLAINLGATFAGVLPGQWIDSPNPNPSDPIKAYIVEYETTPTGVGKAPLASLWVGQGSPNPFSSSARIDYVLAAVATVRLDVYDVLGHRITGQVRTAEAPGIHSFVWDGRDASGKRKPAGIYFYVVRAGNEREVRKVLLVN
jgi:hypothetical protein